MNHKEDIKLELESISPYLAGLNIQSPFKVPKGYFDELPESVLETVSPLAEIKSQPFTVPANYFESLPDLVLERVKPQEETEVIPEPVQSPKPSWIDELINSIAMLFQPRYALRLATIAIVLTAGFFLLRDLDKSDQTLLL